MPPLGPLKALPPLSPLERTSKKVGALPPFPMPLGGHWECPGARPGIVDRGEGQGEWLEKRHTVSVPEEDDDTHDAQPDIDVPFSQEVEAVIWYMRSTSCMLALPSCPLLTLSTI